MRKSIIILALLVFPLIGAAQNDKPNDIWQPLRFLEGDWVGAGQGMSGNSELTQSYEFILRGKFLQMKTRSVFPPQEKNPDGEVHEDFAIFSYDASRKTFIIRAFYVEGFVNTFVLNDTSTDGKTLTFITESVENAPPGTKAKLVFTQTDSGELEESFFVAFPGREYGCFSTNRLKKNSAKK